MSTTHFIRSDGPHDPDRTLPGVPLPPRPPATKAKTVVDTATPEQRLLVSLALAGVPIPTIEAAIEQAGAASLRSDLLPWARGALAKLR